MRYETSSYIQMFQIHSPPPPLIMTLQVLQHKIMSRVSRCKDDDGQEENPLSRHEAVLTIYVLLETIKEKKRGKWLKKVTY